MRSLLLTLALTLALAGCNYGGSNPGGHTPEEISQAERQGPPPPPPKTASTGAADNGNYDGAQLYQQYCGACHNNGKSAPSLVGVFQRRELPSGTPANDARVREVILYGRSKMPSFGRTLSSEQVDDLLAYLHTL